MTQPSLTPTPAVSKNGSHVDEPPAAIGPMIEMRVRQEGQNNADQPITASGQGSRPLLSIIIPAHNEEVRLPIAFAKIDAFLKTQSYRAEVIVVENGSHDRTSEVTREFARTHPYIRLLEVTTRGKGLAVKQGMLAAQGDYRFICDTDLSMPIEEIVKFLPPHSDGYDISIATREGKGAQRVAEPEYRHIMGRVNNIIIQVLAVRGFEDTQCGFKMFSRRAAEDLFAVQRMTGIGFDVEILFIAKRRKYRIREVPITWYFDADSKIKLVQDTLKMLREIVEIRLNWNKGLYAPHAQTTRHRQPQP